MSRKAAEKELPQLRMSPAMRFACYRDFLEDVIRANPESRGLRSRIAEAAGCTPSFLTQVLRGDASFSLDHLLRVRHFLGLPDADWDFLRELAIGERCATLEAKQDSAARIQAIRTKHGSGVLSSFPPVETSAAAFHPAAFSLLHWDIFHLLGAPNSTPGAIARRFGVTHSEVLKVLEDWKDAGLVECAEDGSWRCRAQRFASQGKAVSNTLATMHLVRVLNRAFTGAGAAPHWTAVRLTERDARELRLKLQELHDHAWRLAAASETDGDRVAYITSDLTII